MKINMRNTEKSLKLNEIKMKSIILILIIFISVSGKNDIKLFGSYENEISFLFMKDSSSLYDKNKLKVGINFSYDSLIDMKGTILFRKYIGTNKSNLHTFLPESLVSLIPDTVNYDLNYSPVNDTIIIHEAYLKFSPKKFRLIAGIQDLAWGHGYWHNPSNFWTSPFRLDPKYECFRVPAINLGYEGYNISIYSISGFNENIKDIPLSLLFNLKLNKFLFLGTAGTEVNSYKYHTILNDKWKFRKYLVGMSTKLFFEKGGVWIEGAWNKVKTKNGFYKQYISLLDTSNKRLSTMFKNDRNYIQLVVGVEKEFDLTEGLKIKLEYYLNSDGKTRGEAYYLEDWIEYLNNENEGIVANSLYGEIDYNITKKTAISILFIGNHCDQSMFFKPAIEHRYNEFLRFDLYAHLPKGKDSSEFGKDYYKIFGRITVNW